MEWKGSGAFPLRRTFLWILILNALSMAWLLRTKHQQETKGMNEQWMQNLPASSQGVPEKHIWIGRGSPIMDPISTGHQLNERQQRQIERAESFSSVDYFSCCGLGHRLSKMADAYYVAKTRLNFGFRNHWAFCEQAKDTFVEVFDYFFGPQPFEELKNVSSMNQFLTLRNEIGGFKKFKRWGVDNSSTTLNGTGNLCPCRGHEDFFQTSAKFHLRIRQRFRYQNEVEQFEQKHGFDNHTVIGLHVRAGNGEIGDFSRKGRGVDDLQTWTTSMAKLVETMVDDWKQLKPLPKPPILFLATDTESVVHEMELRLKHKLKVVSFDQEREINGTGVAFGNQILTTGNCLGKWKNSILDMMILSDAHVVIAGRPSSFTQSLPMSLALSRNMTQRLIAAPYCEINRNATLYQCYQDFEDWCCHGKTSFHLEGIATQYEYRRLPLVLDQQDFSKLIHTRPIRRNPPNPRNTRNVPLPYVWS